jgi:hypothetical protein
MFDLSGLIAEFDEQNKIVHLTAKEQIRCKTLEQGFELARALKDILDSHFSDERGYLITDYSKIIIEPKHIDEYAAFIKDIMDKYLHPDGIARYGFEITRVTAQLGHQLYLGSSPNLFNTYEEAIAYIQGLALSNSSVADHSAKSTRTAEEGSDNTGTSRAKIKEGKQ